MTFMQKYLACKLNNLAILGNLAMLPLKHLNLLTLLTYNIIS